MKKEYYYNLKLTEEEFILLYLDVSFGYIKNPIKDLDKRYKKLIDKLNSNFDKVLELKLKEEHKCQKVK